LWLYLTNIYRYLLKRLSFCKKELKFFLRNADKGYESNKEGNMSNPKEKITMWLPIYAEAKFQVEKPDNWDKMDKEDKINCFLDNCKRAGNICSHCNKVVQSDFNLNEDCDLEETVKDQI
jgi:hypothetical protein